MISPTLSHTSGSTHSYVVASDEQRPISPRVPEQSRTDINKKPPKTRDMGMTLQYQIPAIQGDDQSLSGIRSVTVTKSNTDKPSETLRQTLLHGISTGGISGSTNLKLHLVDYCQSRGYDIAFEYALLGSMRQFNSGHSLHDALWTANRLSEGKAIDWKVDFRRYGKEEIALDPAKAHIMDYEKFFDLFKGTELGKVMEKAIPDAMRATVQYFRDHSDRAKQGVNPEITSKGTGDTVSN